MNFKKIAFILSISMFMVSTLSIVSDQTYAYWATNVDVPSVETTVGTISVGDWGIYPLWDSTATYSIGDRVENNGYIYEAKKNNPTREPGVDRGWNSQWYLIGPA